MSLTVKFEGADELVAALRQLPRIATEKAVVRRALILSAEPMRGLASALAPYRPDDPEPHLRDSIIISTATSSHQARQGFQPGAVTVYIGPTRTGGHRHDVEMEFGTFKDAPQPYMRPAWEATRDRTLQDLGMFMWQQIDATAHRLEVRAAKLGG